MNTEIGPLTGPINPFGALLDPEALVAAHERLASRVVGTVYRPLEERRVAELGEAESDGADADELQGGD